MHSSAVKLQPLITAWPHHFLLERFAPVLPAALSLVPPRPEDPLAPAPAPSRDTRGRFTPTVRAPPGCQWLEIWAQPLQSQHRRRALAYLPLPFLTASFIKPQALRMGERTKSEKAVIIFPHQTHMIETQPRLLSLNAWKCLKHFPFLNPFV